MGRIMRVALRTGYRVAITVYNIYGFPGGHQDKHKAGRTDAIFAAARQEMAERGDTYVAIVGDLNAELDDVPSASSLLLQAGWADLGAHPARAVQGGPIPTCFAAIGSPDGNRRDFVLVDPLLLTLITQFKVSDEGAFSGSQARAVPHRVPT
ncbi:MAG: hypothetical protein ACKPKO_34675 [Candidatus Fonsibacter sp.]